MTKTEGMQITDCIPSLFLVMLSDKRFPVLR